MALKDLLTDGHVRPHRTSAKEVADLLRVVGRDFTAFDNLIRESGTRWSQAAFGVAPYSHVRVMVVLAATGGSHGIERP